MDALSTESKSVTILQSVLFLWKAVGIHYMDTFKLKFRWAWIQQVE